jgi:hypothetical protein
VRALPTSFFKYLSFETAGAVLDNRTLRWSTPKCFNDPFDMQIDLGIDCDVEAVAQATLEKMWRRCHGMAPKSSNASGAMLDKVGFLLTKLGRAEFDSRMRPGVMATLETLPSITKKFSADLREALMSTKVLCLSEVKDSILMWSHYAKNHTGLVLEFVNVEGYDSPYKLCRPIEYIKAAPQLGDPEQIAQILSGEGSISSTIVDRMIFSKAEPWAYEKEWRIQTGDGRKPKEVYEDVTFHPQELRTVYFGCQSEAQVVNSLTPLIMARYPHAEIWRGVRDPGSYSLSFQPIKNK